MRAAFPAGRGRLAPTKAACVRRAARGCFSSDATFRGVHGISTVIGNRSAAEPFTPLRDAEEEMRRLGTDLMATGVILGSVAAGAVATLAIVGGSDRRAGTDRERAVVRCETSASESEAESRNAAEASGITVKVSESTITMSKRGSKRGKKKRRCRRIVTYSGDHVVTLSPAGIKLREMMRAAGVSEGEAESARARLVRAARTRAQLEQGLARLEQSSAQLEKAGRPDHVERLRMLEQARAQLEKAGLQAMEARAQASTAADKAGERLSVRCKSLEASSSQSGFSCWLGPSSKR